MHKYAGETLNKEGDGQINYCFSPITLQKKKNKIQPMGRFKLVDCTKEINSDHKWRQHSTLTKLHPTYTLILRLTRKGFSS